MEIAWLIWGFVIGFSFGAWAASALLVAKRFTFRCTYDVKTATFHFPTVTSVKLNGLEIDSSTLKKVGLFDEPHDIMQ